MCPLDCAQGGRLLPGAFAVQAELGWPFDQIWSLASGGLGKQTASGGGGAGGELEEPRWLSPWLAGRVERLPGWDVSQ